MSRCAVCCFRVVGVFFFWCWVIAQKCWQGGSMAGLKLAPRVSCPRRTWRCLNIFSSLVFIYVCSLFFKCVCVCHWERQRVDLRALQGCEARRSKRQKIPAAFGLASASRKSDVAPHVHSPKVRPRRISYPSFYPGRDYDHTVSPQFSCHLSEILPQADVWFWTNDAPDGSSSCEWCPLILQTTFFDFNALIDYQFFRSWFFLLDLGRWRV